jgi:hypothetical protein
LNSKFQTNKIQSSDGHCLNCFSTFYFIFLLFGGFKQQKFDFEFAGSFVFKPSDSCEQAANEAETVFKTMISSEL